jgi:hypothetical protein
MIKRICVPKTSALTPELIELLESPDSVKIIGTLGADGAPCLAANALLTSLNGVTLVLCERLETSRSNKNLVRSIWYDGPVTILLLNAARAFEIRAETYRCLAVGGIFDAVLARVRATNGPDADIAVVWELIPKTCRDVSDDALVAEHRSLHPYDGHLDRSSVEYG